MALIEMITFNDVVNTEKRTFISEILQRQSVLINLDGYYGSVRHNELRLEDEFILRDKDDKIVCSTTRPMQESKGIEEIDNTIRLETWRSAARELIASIVDEKIEMYKKRKILGLF